MLGVTPVLFGAESTTDSSFNNIIHSCGRPAIHLPETALALYSKNFRSRLQAPGHTKKSATSPYNPDRKRDVEGENHPVP